MSTVLFHTPLRMYLVDGIRFESLQETSIRTRVLGLACDNITLLRFSSFKWDAGTLLRGSASDIGRRLVQVRMRRHRNCSLTEYSASMDPLPPRRISDDDHSSYLHVRKRCSPTGCVNWSNMQQLSVILGQMRWDSSRGFCLSQTRQYPRPTIANLQRSSRFDMGVVRISTWNGSLSWCWTNPPWIAPIIRSRAGWRMRGLKHANWSRIFNSHGRLAALSKEKCLM